MTDNWNDGGGDEHTGDDEPVNQKPPEDLDPQQDAISADTEPSDADTASMASPKVDDEPAATDSFAVQDTAAADEEEGGTLGTGVPTAAPAEPTEEQLKALEEKRAKYPWYVVHTYSGYEQRAKLTLEERIKTAGASDKFGNVVVPHEKVVELVRGEKKTTSKKVFPGYILVQCILDDETWHIVKATPKITGFVGDSRNPVPLTKEEVDNLLKQMQGEGQRARPSVQFEQGDSVKVVDGPFAEFNGTVDEVKPDKGKLRVLISIFGRNTPVELDFVQVEKV